MTSTDPKLLATCETCGKLRASCVCEEAQNLPNEAADLQGQFWVAIGRLEHLLNLEIDGTKDLADQTLQSLMEDEDE